MALTTRGKALIAGGAVVAVLGGGVAALVLSGDNPVAKALDVVVPGDQTPPTPCPLTNQPVGGDKEPPARPALAVKVENTPDAMPLVGLDKADVVYEEVVEGGITRFIVVFNCSSAERVGPVRSARTTDPKILLQFSPHPLLAYSGGANRVVKIIKESGVVGMTEGDPAAALHPRRCSRGAAQPVRQHEQALGGRPEARQGRARARGDLQLRRSEQAQQEDHAPR